MLEPAPKIAILRAGMFENRSPFLLLVLLSFSILPAIKRYNGYIRREHQVQAFRLMEGVFPMKSVKADYRSSP